MGLILTPQELGMPPRFTGWRDGQDDAIDRISDAFRDYRFVVMCAPVGSGKTATYVAVALLNGWRVLINTSSKALQDQLMRDFSGIGMVDIRGRANYTCCLGPGITCEDGGHLKCNYSPTDRCAYRKAYNKALEAQLVVTNYSYDMLSHLYGEGLGHFDLVVLDEAHDCDKTVCDVMGQTFTERQINTLLGSRFPDDPLRCGMASWVSWARNLYPRALRAMEALNEDAKAHPGGVPETLARQLRQFSELTSSLQMLLDAEGPWGVDEVKGWGQNAGRVTGYRLEPLWARQYAERLLFRGAERILLVSATIRHKTMDLLGVGPTEYDFQEYPYLFPIRRSPIYYVPTAKVQWDSTDEEMEALQARIDEIQLNRQDRNGIIHSVSYNLCKWVMERCMFNHTFTTHDRNSESTRKTIQHFKSLAHDPPHVLVSPSIATGHDFPYSEAEYQIIPKMPFIVTKGSNIMAMRTIKKHGGDPEWKDYVMAQNLAQAFGRPMRAPDDRCETFVLDDNFSWVSTKLRKHFPDWVIPLIQRARRVPNPPPPLSSERKRPAASLPVDEET